MDILKKFIQFSAIVKSYSSNCKIIAVTKTHSMDVIMPLLNYGHLDYGENKVQEATLKWTPVLKNFSNLNLHFIGKLQSNKAEEAVRLFSHIHSLDSIKLAQKLSTAEIKLNKKLKYFIQVNISQEFQKSGVLSKDLTDLIRVSIEHYRLNIIGLMCIPAINSDATLAFSVLNKLAFNNNLKDLSMGMTEDYVEAIKQGSTYVRIGSGIFGERKY
jgi:hypothetical protein